MSNTVFVKLHQSYSSATIYLTTVTGPCYVFSCEYSDKDAYIWFQNDEEIKLYTKLQVAAGLLNKDSNFAGILAKEYRKRGEKFEGIEAIIIDTNMFGNEEVFPVEMNSDIEEMVRAVYRRQKDYIVMDDDLEDEILERANKMTIVKDHVEVRFKEDVVYPMTAEQLKRVIFFSREDEDEYFEKLYKQIEGKKIEFFMNYELHENSSEESKLYLELLKAQRKGDNERIREICFDLKCI